MSNHEFSHCGGLILCGGKSRRMGRPKLLLPFGQETLLQRVIGILQSVVSPVTVVAAREQSLPELPAEIRIARDDLHDYGPLGGLFTGLKSAQDSSDIVFVSACDAPLLKPEFIRALLRKRNHHDVVICQDRDYFYPLAAVYRTSVWTHIDRLIQSGQRRPIALLEHVNTCVVSMTELQAIDPKLDSLRNTNTPEDYRAALRAAGLPAPPCADEADAN